MADLTSRTRAVLEAVLYEVLFVLFLWAIFVLFWMRVRESNVTFRTFGSALYRKPVVRVPDFTAADAFRAYYSIGGAYTGICDAYTGICEKASGVYDTIAKNTGGQSSPLMEESIKDKMKEREDFLLEQVLKTTFQGPSYHIPPRIEDEMQLRQ